MSELQQISEFEASTEDQDRNKHLEILHKNPENIRDFIRAEIKAEVIRQLAEKEDKNEE